MNNLRVYIGFDPRESDAYEVCEASLLRHASIPVEIIKLDRSYIDRPFHMEGVQMIDDRDGRPFSTEFAFSRFMVPSINKYQGWALFCDCDFLFTDDVANLLPLLEDRYAAMVVKHEYTPRETVKMDGVSQAAYRRKNWSSFILWNCAHPQNKALQPKTVNTASGQFLHRFEWLTSSNIGSLPNSWNWLSGVSTDIDEIPSAIHFTLGVPSMKGHENSPYADLWRSELNRLAKGNTKMGTSRTIKMSGIKGAGMVNTGGPGKMAMKVKPRMAGAKFTGGANSYKPAKMSVQKQGE